MRRTLYAAAFAGRLITSKGRAIEIPISRRSDFHRSWIADDLCYEPLSVFFFFSFSKLTTAPSERLCLLSQPINYRPALSSDTYPSKKVEGRRRRGKSQLQQAIIYNFRTGKIRIYAMYGTVSVPPLPESTHPFLIKTPPRRRTHHSCVHAGEFAGDIKDRMDSFVTFCSTSSPCGDMTKVSSSVQVDGETAALRKGGVGIDSSEERLWNNWISDYSAGAWGSQATPPPPLLSFLPSLSESATPLATPPFDHSTSNSPLLDQGPTTPPPIDDYVLPSLTPCGPDPSLFTDRSPEALLLFYKNK